MTDADRARELLLEARRRVDTRLQPFLCMAIRASEDNHPSYTVASLVLRYWIMDLLDPYHTYDNWVRHEHDSLMRNTPLWERNEKAREGRLAWIDWMLEQDLSRIVRKYNR